MSRYEWREGYGIWDSKRRCYVLLDDDEHARILLAALQYPPAAALWKIAVSHHAGTHDYEVWAGLQAPPAAADELSIAAHGKRMYDRGFADGQKEARIGVGVLLATAKGGEP